MSLLLVSYILNFFLLIFLGLFFLKKYHNLGGIFFLIFCISTALWFVFYILTYFFTQDLNLLLLFGKIAYFLSIVTLYSFLLFLVYFRKKKEKIFNAIFLSFLLIMGVLAYTYIATPAIVDGLYFNVEQNDWYESEGIFYIFHLILSFLFFPFLLFLSHFRLKRVGNIDKKRLQYILVGMTVFIILTFVFLLILPAFGIFAMEKYIAFFFLPFIISVFYAIRKYDFLDFKIALSYIITHVYALLTSFFVLQIIKNYSFYLSEDFRSYWGLTNLSLFVELILGITIFYFTLYFIEKKIGGNIGDIEMTKKFNLIKSYVSNITDASLLNQYLGRQFLSLFNIEFVFINTNINNTSNVVVNFFLNNTDKKFFMYDEVFIEENKNKFLEYEDILEKEKVYIVFPIRNNLGELIALLELGRKSFKDPYFSGEIKQLGEFAVFLSVHLKYISVYQKIQDITISLDKQVDEKTIEYNTLLNKQKEFIAYIGHEIKNPITNSIFLCDSLNDELGDLEDTKLSKTLREDGSILYGELLKVSELVKQIFSAQQFDLDKIKLYKKLVDIGDFLHSELHIFENSHPNIYFDIKIDDVGRREIDETQFRQVIHNLLTNAVKFANKNTPKIYVRVKENTNKKITICIEDNGIGFHEIDIEYIFDKYSTGGGSSVGLGMGLYLCKKIVELHKGKISAGNGKKLTGASFSITL